MASVPDPTRPLQRRDTYPAPAKSELAKLEYLDTWYYCDAPRSHRPRLDLVRRTSGLAEVVGNLDTDTAAYEARRCMSCGLCVSGCPCGAIEMVPEV